MITQPTEEYFKDGGWGWDGTRWRKLPMIWGFTDRLVEGLSGAAVGGGDATVGTTAVPSGEVHSVQTFYFAHNAGANKRVYAYLYNGSTPVYIFDNPACVSGTNYMLQFEACLEEGDTLEVVCVAPGDGKSVLAGVWGYKMVVA